MPWFIEERDGRYCVVKGDRDDPGETEACHDTREKALAHQRALYANVPEARVAALDEQREIRSATFQPVDVADDGSRFEGYAAVFDEEAEIEVPGVGVVTESVQRGAFRKALAAGGNVPMLYHHLDTHPPLATTAGGTLSLEEDSKGLRVKAEIAKGYIGDAVRELVKRGDIPGMSWGFVAGKGNSKVERRAGGNLHRTLLGFKKILDVSPTWDPTYRGTEAQFRSRTFGLAFSPEEMQQLLIGGHPQVEAEGIPPDDGQEETAETRSLERDGGSGATGRSVAARRRALQFLVLETGGIDETR
jgi:Escherichia/Staphylococcus phage prohead protease